MPVARIVRTEQPLKNYRKFSAATQHGGIRQIFWRKLIC